jgi:ribosomal protein S18 acetylase RimI-like enzyme
VIRKATEADLDVVRELWEAFYAEWPEPEHRRKDWSDVVDHVRRHIDENVVLIAGEDDGPIGFSLAWPKNDRVGYVSDLYVRPEARRRGIAQALLRETAVHLDREFVTLTTETRNPEARAFYGRLGFVEESVNFVIESKRLMQEEEPGPSFGSVHVQSDDVNAVVRAVEQFVPRLPGTSRGSVVTPPRNGWVAVYDELCDREPALLHRLGRELSDRMGAVTLTIGMEQGEVVTYLLHERGRMVDEYVSVPEQRGELPPGDVIALGANPTVVARLTGADPKQVRAVARTAPSPADLPRAPALLAALAEAMRIEGATYGYVEARELPDAIAVGR